MQQNYCPSSEDVNRFREGNINGMKETVITIGRLTYRFLEIQSQRSERRKWLHLFEGIALVIFVSDISSYDTLLFEDETVNRFEEDIALFDSICNSRWFMKTEILLLFNKVDLFKDKLLTRPIRDYFPGYHGGFDYDVACDYARSRFLPIKTHERERIHTKFTAATTDTTLAQYLVATVQDTIIEAKYTFRENSERIRTH